MVANIYATFELRKFIYNYFFEVKCREILVVVGVFVKPTKKYLRWQDIHWSSSRNKCSYENILLKKTFAAQLLTSSPNWSPVKICCRLIQRPALLLQIPMIAAVFVASMKSHIVWFLTYRITTTNPVSPDIESLY